MSLQGEVQEFVVENINDLDGKSVSEIQKEFIKENGHVSKGTVRHALINDEEFSEKLAWKKPEVGPQRAEVLDVDNSSYGEVSKYASPV